MLTGKQRTFLKGIGHNTEVSLIIGKEGYTKNVEQQIEQILNKREIMKIKFLDIISDDKEEISNQIIQDLDAEFVQLIGSKLTIYKKSKDAKIALPKK